MKITRFEFHDHAADWHLEPTAFDSLNLLVGVSGVGKTKILEAFRRVCRLALESDYNPGLIEWNIEFEQEDKSYRWSGRTETPPDDGLGELEASSTSLRAAAPTRIANEQVSNGTSASLIDRDAEVFTFQGDRLPRLRNTVSAIALLENEEAVAPLRRGFKRALFSKASELPLRLPSQTFRVAGLVHQTEIYTRLREGPDGFAKFKEALAESGLKNLSEYAPLAAFYLQEAFPEQFAELQDVFIDTFPFVTDVKIVKSNRAQSSTAVTLELAIRETDLNGWVMQSDISSGMLKTLVHAIETFLAPPGSVIVIDEFENSLGINCMSDLTRLILRRTDCQVILTSHHPYIIGHVPVDAWKLVTRKGGHVSVTSARDIPELKSASRLDSFTRLINLPEYRFEEGIQ
ncbi:MAG: AAA family ATPase [Byssovorax sp.]